MTKKMKKILSMITALAMSASAFASLSLTASAGDVTTIYSEDFENISSYPMSRTGNQTKLTVAENQGTSLTTKSLMIGSDRNESGKYLGYTKDLSDNSETPVAISTYKNVTVDFDLEAKQIRSDKDAQVDLGFGDSQNNSLFSLAIQTGKSFGTNTLVDAKGGKTTVKGTALHFSMKLDFIEKTQNIVVTDLTGASVESVSVDAITQLNFAGFYLPDANYRYGYFVLDNLVITTEAIDSDVAEYTVKYVCNDETVKETTEIGVVGQVPTFISDDFIVDNARKFTYVADDAESLSIDKNGETVVTVQVDEIPAVTSIGVTYVADGATVAEKTVSIASGYFVGDKYTYISNTVIQGEDEKYYAVGNDYTDEAASYGIGSDPPVNNVLSQTVVLSENTAITYEVKESSDVVYFGEWEDIFNAIGGTYGTSRYIASGGRMATTTSKVPFYTVPQTGNYQIVLVGGAKKRATSVYKSEEAAAAATAYNDGTELLSLSSTISSSSDVLATYSVKTALLTEGDVLTIRGFGANGTTENLDYVLIRHIVSGDIIGPEGISILPGGNTAQFMFDSGLTGDVEWTITDENGDAIDGVTIDEDGVVTVAETAQPIKPAVIRASMSGGTVTGTKEIDIDEPVVNGFEISGPTNVAVGQTYEYTTKYVNDWYGQDISDYVDVWVESSNPEVATASGNTITVVSAGETTVTVHVGEDDAEDITVTANYYYLTGKATGNETAIDASNFVTSDNIKGYLVTTAKDGVKVSQETVDTVPATVDTTGADSYEIAPVYYYDINSASTTLPDEFADGLYTITAKKGETKRADIYVNGYMIGNNVDQYGISRSIVDGAEYTAHDVKVEGGSIKIETKDLGGSGVLSWTRISKAPSIVTRTPKVYVVGDSLVAEYYGSFDESAVVGGARTGWGQVIGNYFDGREVVNLANSGTIARTILAESYPAIIHSAQPGDYLILESGYNDANPKNNTTREQMYEYIQEMVDGAHAAGLHTVLVSPNASAHDYRSVVQYAATMTQVAEDMMEKYDDVIYVDLSRLSYEFLKSTGISTKVSEDAINYAPVYNEDGTLASVTVTPVAAEGFVKMPHFIWNASMKPVETTEDKTQVDATYNLSTAGDDTLHSSYVAAMKWAEIVAQGMKDAGVDFVNTTFSYTFTDTIGNTITCQVK